MLRIATPGDAPAMLEIYQPFILHSGITQEVLVPGIEEFTSRVAKGLPHFPWLVEETNRKVTGYAYASRYREREGYKWCVETSIYLAPASRGKGVANRLYLTLLHLLRIMGYVNAYAVITLPNPPSIRFHEKIGFRHFATYDKVGFKLDVWHDVAWMQIKLQEHPYQPQSPLAFGDLDQAVVQSILNEQPTSPLL